MAIAYSVNNGGMFVHAKATGVLTVEDVLAHEQAIQEDFRIKTGFRELFDASMIAESLLDFESLQLIAQQIKANPKRSIDLKLAIVPGKGDSFVRARYIEKLLEATNQKVIVFNDATTARVWLGVSEEPIAAWQDVTASPQNYTRL